MEAEKHYKKGLWTKEEDRILLDYINVHGRGHWNTIPKITGLKRCGKSCRLRWLNYLSPNVKHGDFSKEEEDLIIRLHNLLGNRWALIAGRVPGRTDNQVKNHWNTHLRKKLGIKKQSRKSPNSIKKQTLCSSNRAEERLKQNMDNENIANENFVFSGGDDYNVDDDGRWISNNWIESFISYDDLNMNCPSLAELLDEYNSNNLIN